MKQYNRILSTPFGPVVLLWSVFIDRPVIFHVLLSNPAVTAEQKLARVYPGSTAAGSTAAGSTAASCSDIDGVAGDIEAFLHGEDIRFSLHMIRLDLCPGFQQGVLQADFKIPRGSVSTYQRIAAHLGKKNGARAVGNALANNPFPVIIPCHRAVRSDGFPGGYQGGTEMKRTLLEMEGIRFNDAGRIMVMDFYY